ncbi:hypothetical protein V5F40_15480 [Xanthobacter sp. DSM 14520]|uniref:hypothetical protein n=1 Tax=Xanthobacter autotrophicus (strain ATCC BAA-1158 / Py2) TaxID=78245 RepID=UPI003728E71A
MSDITWAHLDKQKVGKFGEYFAKMALVRAGLDVYSPEVDDRSIDAIVRLPGLLGAQPRYLDLQVKAARIGSNNYIYVKKRLFPMREDAFIAIVVFKEGSEPDFFLIPLKTWETPAPPFSSPNYENKKSEPEWGLSIGKNYELHLARFAFATIVEDLKNGIWPQY